MRNHEQILNEIRELKSVIAKLIGVSESPSDKSFSTEAVDKATKEFQKLRIERGEWVISYDINKYIKSASYNSGKFIIEEFQFTNYFKRGSSVCFNKQDLIALGKELKARKVDLGRYQELKEDQLKFKKYLENASNNRKGKAGYKVPKNLKDITSTPPKLPTVKELRAEVGRLREEFLQYNLTEYIDIYRDSYAMSKNLYYIKKYIKPHLFHGKDCDPDIRKRINRWIKEFNNVNHLLQESKVKKEKFVTVKDEDIIRL